MICSRDKTYDLVNGHKVTKNGSRIKPMPIPQQLKLQSGGSDFLLPIFSP